MSPRPAWTYQADVPYIFAIYAHEDEAEAHREMTWLHEQEFNVRCDPDLHSKDAWSQGLADAIEQASLVLCFVSGQSRASTAFGRMIEHANENSSLLLNVHLGPPQTGSETARMETAPLLKYEMTDDEYREKLVAELISLVPATRIQPVFTPAMPILDERGAPNLVQHGVIAVFILALGILAYIFMVP